MDAETDQCMEETNGLSDSEQEAVFCKQWHFNRIEVKNLFVSGRVTREVQRALPVCLSSHLSVCGRMWTSWSGLDLLCDTHTHNNRPIL